MRGDRGDQAGARGGIRHGSRSGARARGPRPGAPDGASELPGGVRGVPLEARAQVPLMKIPDPRPIRAFLEERHVNLASEVAAFASREIAPRPEPRDDDSARKDARALLTQVGAAGWFDPIRDQDWRACCLTREALAAASPLADAVFALQGLGTLPILLSENAGARERWVDAAISGRAMAAFAMTEPEAGSGGAAVKTTARP